MKQRIYRYDNVKALLIFLVVLGHMTTDYVSDSHLVRWTTLWIYSFHMPAFIFISGLVHKRYICGAGHATQVSADGQLSPSVKGETRMRWDKFLGFFLCGYALKVFLQLSRTLMGQHPLWHTIAEPGIPWYLFVMAEYELLFYLMRRIDSKVKPQVMIAGAFALSAAAGYFPAINDTFCLSRMINFLPIYMLGYYLDMKKFNSLLSGRGYHDPGNQGGSQGDSQGAESRHSLAAEHKAELPKKNRGLITAAGRVSTSPNNYPDKNRQNNNRHLIAMIGWLGIAISLAVCCFGRWGLYSWRKWFTGRRSYEFLTDFFSYAYNNGWWIRIAVWAVAVAITLCIIAVIPDKDFGYVTTIGSRTLNVYFWHRPVCYLFRNWAVLPKLFVLFGGTYDASLAGQVKGLAFAGHHGAMLAAYAVYILIAAAMTALFSLKVFEHPCSDLMKAAKRVCSIK